MRLLGITDLAQAHPGLLNTRDLDRLLPLADETRGEDDGGSGSGVEHITDRDVRDAHGLWQPASGQVTRTRRDEGMAKAKL